MTSPVIDQVTDATRHPEVTRFVTADVAVANRFQPPHWRTRIYRLGSGPFEYSYERVDLGDGVRLAYVRYGGAVRAVGDFQSRAVQLLFPSGNPARVAGVPVQPDETMIVTFGPCTAEASTGRPVQSHNVVLAGAAYEALAATVPGLAQLAGAYTAGRKVLRRDAEGGALCAALRDTFRRLDTAPDSALAPAHKAALRSAFIGAAGRVLRAMAGDAAELLPPPHPRARALALAVERWVWEHVALPGAGPVSLEQASKATGYSVRSLQLAVEQHFGVTFVKLVRAARLHHVHEELRHGGGRQTVSEVATRFGFWHLGRFSHYYREMYGDPPSHTAARGRQQRALLAVK